MFIAEDFYKWIVELHQEKATEHLNMVRRDETKYKLSVVAGEIRVLDTIISRLEKDFKS